LLLGLVVGLAAAAARADVDVEVPAAARSRGTILPAGEVETYRFRATAGTALSFSLVRGRGSDLDFSVTLLDPGDSPVAIPPENLQDTGGKVVVKSLPLATTGLYSLQVAGTGTGDYSLTIKAKPQGKFGETSTPAGSASISIDFSAPAGSDVVLAAKAAPGAAAPQPRFGTLQGPTLNQDLSAAGTLKPTSHTVKLQDLAEGGDFNVQVFNAAGNDQAVTVAIAVRPPKVRAAKLDVRGVSLGRPLGGETVVGRTLDGAGGMVGVIDPGSDLYGAWVEVPQGALDGPTLITLQSSGTSVVGTDLVQAAGPSVDLGPSGTQFLSPVTVVLPYDLAQVPADATPDDIGVQVFEGDGSSFTLPVVGVDPVGGTVSVLANGFSVCIPYVEPGPPRLGLDPGGDEYWVLTMDFEAQPDGGNDSRARSFYYDFGDGSFYGDGTFQASLTERQWSIINGNDGSGGINPGTQSTETTDFITGTWAYRPDGRTVDVVAGGPHNPAMRIARDGSAMVGSTTDPAEPNVHLDFFLRKNTTPLSVEGLAGTYTAGGMEINLDSSFSGEPAALKVHRIYATLTLDGEGGVSGSSAERRDVFDQGAFRSRQEGGNLPSGATYSVEAGGTILAFFPPEDPGDTGDFLRFYPGPGGNVMFGTDRDPQFGTVFFLFLVRQGSDVPADLLSGAYLGADIRLEPRTYSVNPGGGNVTMGDFELFSEDLSFAFAGTAQAAVTGTQHEVRRNEGSTGGVLVQETAQDFPLNVSVDRKGKTTFSVPGQGGGVVGAVTPDGMFGFFLGDPRDANTDYNFGLVVRPPPLK